MILLESNILSKSALNGFGFDHLYMHYWFYSNFALDTSDMHSG